MSEWRALHYLIEICKMNGVIGQRRQAPKLTPKLSTKTHKLEQGKLKGKELMVSSWHTISRKWLAYFPWKENRPQNTRVFCIYQGRLSILDRLLSEWNHLIKLTFLLCIPMLASLAYTDVSHANSRPCLMVFVGDCADDQTHIMKRLSKSVASGNFPELLRCTLKYTGYSGSNEIEGFIQSFRDKSPRGSVTIVGHSLGGSTALSFLDHGADHVVTLDAYYPLTHCDNLVALTKDVMKNALDGLKNRIFLRRPPFARKNTEVNSLWTYVASEYPEMCRRSTKKGRFQLELAKYIGSGPIGENDAGLPRTPNKSFFCNGCDHCDVEKMFEKARRQIRTRL